MIRGIFISPRCDLGGWLGVKYRVTVVSFWPALSVSLSQGGRLHLLLHLPVVVSVIVGDVSVMVPDVVLVIPWTFRFRRWLGYIHYRHSYFWFFMVIFITYLYLVYHSYIVTYQFLVCHGYIRDRPISGLSWLHLWHTCFWFVTVTLVTYLYLVCHGYIGNISFFLVYHDHIGDIPVSGLSWLHLRRTCF